MVFAHDTEYALAGAAALVNTEHDPPGPSAAGIATDELRTLTDLRAFCTTWRWTGSPPGDRTDLDQVRTLRRTLRAMWTAPVPDLVTGINALLAENGALPHLVEHDGFGWHVHATPPDAPIAARMAVEAAMALVDVVRSDETERLRVCAGEDCQDVVVDLSRNRSRRYCEGTCGTRANVAAYRARKAATG